MKRGNIHFRSRLGREDFPGGMAEASFVKVKTVAGLHGRVIVLLHPEGPMPELTGPKYPFQV